MAGGRKVTRGLETSPIAPGQPKAPEQHTPTENAGVAQGGTAQEEQTPAVRSHPGLSKGRKDLSEGAVFLTSPSPPSQRLFHLVLGKDSSCQSSSPLTVLLAEGMVCESRELLSPATSPVSQLLAAAVLRLHKGLALKATLKPSSPGQHMHLLGTEGQTALSHSSQAHVGAQVQQSWTLSLSFCKAKS